MIGLGRMSFESEKGFHPPDIILSLDCSEKDGTILMEEELASTELQSSTGFSIFNSTGICCTQENCTVEINNDLYEKSSTLELEINEGLCCEWICVRNSSQKKLILKKDEEDIIYIAYQPRCGKGEAKELIGKIYAAKSNICLGWITSGRKGGNGFMVEDVISGSGFTMENRQGDKIEIKDPLGITIATGRETLALQGNGKRCRKFEFDFDSQENLSVPTKALILASVAYWVDIKKRNMLRCCWLTTFVILTSLAIAGVCICGFLYFGGAHESTAEEDNASMSHFLSGNFSVDKVVPLTFIIPESNPSEKVAEEVFPTEEEYLIDIDGIVW